MHRQSNGNTKVNESQSMSAGFTGKAPSAPYFPTHALFTKELQHFTNEV